MNVGVVVGRFQIDEPHAGHLYLLDTVSKENDKLVIVLGTGPLPTSCRKPLPFETRKGLLQKFYPDATIFELEDHPDDTIWSTNLDWILADWDEFNEITLYHSRDSFKEVYTGIHQLKEIDAADLGVSGTLHREQIAKHPMATKDFARGVIWANENKFPTVYSVVDVAAWNRLVPNEVCLITKAGRSGLQFPGGFTEVSSPSDEYDALKELEEETGLKRELVTEIQYAGSLNIHDWRYNSEKDTMRSRVFTCIAEGTPIGGDDAETAAWYNWRELSIEDFNPCHQPIVELLKDLGI